MDLSLGAMAFLCSSIFLAGFIDSVAGGGGLISLPVYMIVGIPTHLAIGCNKFTAVCGTTFATARFFKNGQIEKTVAIISAVCALATSYFGMKLALSIDEKILKMGLVILLPILAVILLLNKNFGTNNEFKSMTKRKAGILAAVIGLLIGFYDGLIGPGTGTFAILAYSTFMKFDLKTAAGNAKVLNLASGYAALTAVILGNAVIYKVVIPAAIFGILGNYIGSGLAIKKGAAFIRPLIIIVIVLLLGKLLFDVFAPYIFN